MLQAIRENAMPDAKIPNNNKLENFLRNKSDLFAKFVFVFDGQKGQANEWINIHGGARTGYKFSQYIIDAFV